MQSVNELLAHCKKVINANASVMTTTTMNIFSESTREQLMVEMTGSNFKVQEAVSFIRETKWQTSVICESVTIHVLHRARDINADVPVSQVQRVAWRVACMFRVLGMQGPMVYWFIPSLATKVFPEISRCVDKSHVNSAYTYTDGHEVYIYRREEFPKVMLHEALHHSQFDTGSRWEQPLLKRVFQKFSISPETKLRPNEAIVETWAELFHLAFISHEYNLDFKKLYAMELQWSLQQARRIVSRQGGGGGGIGPWKEKTHAYSYYVIRSFFMFDPNAFVRIAREKKSIIRLRASYMDLAEKIADSRAYRSAIREASVPKHACFRMTLFGDL